MDLIYSIHCVIKIQSIASKLRQQEYGTLHRIRFVAHTHSAQTIDKNRQMSRSSDRIASALCVLKMEFQPRRTQTLHAQLWLSQVRAEGYYDYSRKLSVCAHNRAIKLIIWFEFQVCSTMLQLIPDHIHTCNTVYTSNRTHIYASWLPWLRASCVPKLMVWKEMCAHSMRIRL